MFGKVDVLSSFEHVLMAYAYIFWTTYISYKEDKTISIMRLHFLASGKRRPDQFTVGAHIF